MQLQLLRKEPKKGPGFPNPGSVALAVARRKDTRKLVNVSIHSRPILRLTPQATDRGRADAPSIYSTGKGFKGRFHWLILLSTTLFPRKEGQGTFAEAPLDVRPEKVPARPLESRSFLIASMLLWTSISMYLAVGSQILAILRNTKKGPRTPIRGAWPS